MIFARILNPRGSFVLVLALVLGAMTGGCASPSSNGTPEARMHHERGCKLMEEGEKAQDTKKYDDAITEFELALRIDPLFALCMANLGIACHKRGFTDRGITEIENAIKTNENIADSYNYLGEIYFDQKRYKEAEEQFNQAINTYPAYAEAWFNLGRLHETQNRDDLALDAYSTAARDNPKFVEANVAAGRLYLRNGVEKDAEQHFMLALEYDKKNPLALHGIGVIRLKNEQWEEAIRKVRAALEVWPDKKEFQDTLELAYKKTPKRVAKAFVDTGRAAKETGKWDEALADLESAGRIDPKLIDVPVIRAQVYLDMKPARIDEADKAAKAAFALDPKNRDARFVTAVVRMAAQDWKRAEDLLRALVREDGNVVKFHQYLGVVYFRERQYRKAEREWQAALECDPAPSDAQKAQLESNLKEFYKTPGIKQANEFNDQGTHALKKRDYDEAFKLFKAAIELDDQFAVAFANMGLLAIEKKDWKFARVKTEEALQRDRDLAKAHNNLGVINSTEGRLNEAEANFKNASALAPRDPDPWHNLGTLYVREKKITEAEAAFEMAINLNPKYYQSHYELALIYIGKGLLQKAETRLDIAIRAGPKFIPARAELARLYLKQKRNEDAVKLLEEAHALDESAPEPWLGFAEAKEALGDKANAADAYLEAASRFAARGLFVQAVDACQRAVELAPNMVMAQSDYGVALMNVGRYSEAITALRRAVELNSQLPVKQQQLVHLLRLGGCYAKRGDKKRAADAYRDILNENKEMYYAMEALAELYTEGASDNPITKSEAIELLEKALRIDPYADRKTLIRQTLDALKKK